MPRDRRVLELDEASRRALMNRAKMRIPFSRDAHTSPYLSVILEDIFNLKDPAHIERLGQVGPLATGSRVSGLLDEASVLSREPDALQVTQMLIEESAIATRDDVHDVLGVFGQLLQRAESAL